MPEGIDPTEYRKALGQEMKKEWEKADEQFVKKEEEKGDKWEIQRAKHDRKEIGRYPLAKARQTPEYYVAKLLKRGKYTTNEAGEMVDQVSGMTTEQLALKEQLYKKMEQGSLAETLEFIHVEGKSLPASVFTDEKTQKKAREVLDGRMSNIWFDEQADTMGQRDKNDEQNYGDLRNTAKFAEAFGIKPEYLTYRIESAVAWYIQYGNRASDIRKLLSFFPQYDPENLISEKMHNVVQEAVSKKLKEGRFNPAHWVEIINLVGLEKLNIDEGTLLQTIKKQDEHDVLAVGRLMKASFTALSGETQKQLMAKLRSSVVFNESMDLMRDFQKAFDIPKNELQKFLVDIAFREHAFSGIPGHIASSIDLKDAETQKYVIESLTKLLERADLRVIAGIHQELLRYEDFYLNDEGLQQKVKEKMVSALLGHQTSIANQLRGIFSEKHLTDPEVSNAVKDAFIWILKDYPDSLESHGSNRDFVRSFQISEEIMSSAEVQQAVKSALMAFLKLGHDGVFLKYLENYGRSDSFKQDEELRNAGKACIIKNVDAGHDWSLVNGYFAFSEDEIRQCQRQAVIENLSAGDVGWAREIQVKYKIEDSLEEFKKQGSAVFNSVVDLFEFKTLKDFSDFVDKGNKGYVAYLLFETPNQGTQLVKADLAAVKKANIFLYEAEVLKRKGVNLQRILEDNPFEEYFNLILNLNAYTEAWKDEQNVMNPFREGAGIFGVEKMLAYANRPNLSRHDAFHSFQAVIKLYKASELSAEQFYGNILSQVNKDDAQYESGTAHHELNAIALTLDTDFEEVFAALQKYQNIPMLQELVENFKSSEDVFKSWKNLKRYNQLVKLLEKTEILDQLTELKQQGKDKLYNYVETLAFHPNSQVDMEAVIKFWRDPGKFIETMDTHTPPEIHNRKKPSNYTDIPNLDLTAEELRDALVEGKLDTLQAFRPMQIEYELAKNPEEAKALPVLVKEALGSRREKVQGNAKNPGKLFSELKRYFGVFKVSLEDYISGKVTEIPSSLQEQVNLALYNPQYGITKPEIETVKVVAKINLKSDPNGVLAGNDTACCMPFGSGKNNVYTFNPDTSLFTLQIQRPDGSLRTIAQSVLTKDRNIGKNVADLLADMNRVGEHMDKLVSEDVLVASENTLACDNAEVSPNFKDTEHARIIEAVYKDFFAEYMRRFAQAQNFDPSHVVIGKGYSDTLTHLPEINNTYVPAAPVGYSDKTAATVYNLDLKKENTRSGIINRKIDIQPMPPVAAESLKPNVNGVDLLTFEDTLPVAYLEGKAYSSNESLMTYLHNMENGLIAKDINNAAKNRPNMSIKYTDSAGMMRGYILAYEGIRGEESRQVETAYDDYGEEYESTVRQPLQGERVVYISDLSLNQTE